MTIHWALAAVGAFLLVLTPGPRDARAVDNPTVVGPITGGRR